MCRALLLDVGLAAIEYLVTISITFDEDNIASL